MNADYSLCEQLAHIIIKKSFNGGIYRQITDKFEDPGNPDWASQKSRIAIALEGHITAIDAQMCINAYNDRQNMDRSKADQIISKLLLNK